jgi:hypothetical protein
MGCQAVGALSMRIVRALLLQTMPRVYPLPLLTDVMDPRDASNFQFTGRIRERLILRYGAAQARSHSPHGSPAGGCSAAAAAGWPVGLTAALASPAVHRRLASQQNGAFGVVWPLVRRVLSVC